MLKGSMGVSMGGCAGTRRRVSPDVKNCRNCVLFRPNLDYYGDEKRDGYCKKYHIRITDVANARECSSFANKNNAKKNFASSNKGLEIRQNKLNKQAKKRATVKDEQQDLICFVEFSEKIIERIDGKYRHPTRTEHGRGLQIQNKIYLDNGKYKMVNRKTLKITKRYDNVPEWATDILVDKFSDPKTKIPAAVETKEIAQKSQAATRRKSCKTCENFVYGVGKNGRPGYIYAR